ncbi:unnamed protein product [Echinostoma caproni]|uniref:DM14 domain-containing protein n=1 Tax=Echinostoma caproni TaxID=27848 RepID=A0A183A8K2_9TREM|nr:unnamed protein product [Echinostoma caproni]
MLRRSRSARSAGSTQSHVDFVDQVNRVLCAGSGVEDDKDELEEELANLVGEPVPKENSDPKTQDEELAEELEAILQAYAPDTNPEKSETNRSSGSHIRKPMLAESSTSGTSEQEVEKRCVSDAVQVDLTPYTDKAGVNMTTTEQQSLVRAARVKRVIDMLDQRRQELLGEMELAKRHMIGAQNVTTIIKAVEAGQPVDLTQLPSKPSLNTVFNGPILGGIACEPPALVRLDLENAADSTEQEKILVSMLKSQVSEAMQLAQEQTRMKSPRTAEELTDIANGSQSTVSMLSVQHKRPVSLIPQFRKATLPIINKNGDMKEGVVEITVCWGVKANSLTTSDAFQLPASQMQILFPYPSENDGQSHFSTKAPFSNRYSRGRVAQELRINTVNWFVRRLASIRLNPHEEMAIFEGPTMVRLYTSSGYYHVDQLSFAEEQLHQAGS